MDEEGCIFKYSIGFGGKTSLAHGRTLSSRVQNSSLPSKEQETRSDLSLSFSNQDKARPGRALGSGMKQTEFSLGTIYLIIQRTLSCIFFASICTPPLLG